MLIPLSWLKRYVAIDVPADELAHRLTMAGIEVESLHRIGGHLDPDLVVVGEVVGLEPHPNADRLRLPTVDLGNGETAKVVCGAPNVAVGQKIAFARLGARLFNTHVRPRGTTAAGQYTRVRIARHGMFGQGAGLGR